METVYHLVALLPGKMHKGETPTGMLRIARSIPGRKARSVVDSNGALVDVDAMDLLTKSHHGNQNISFVKEWVWLDSNGMNFITVKSISSLEELIDFIIKNREIFADKDSDIINGLTSSVLGGD